MRCPIGSAVADVVDQIDLPGSGNQRPANPPDRIRPAGIKLAIEYALATLWKPRC